MNKFNKKYQIIMESLLQINETEIFNTWFNDIKNTHWKNVKENNPKLLETIQIEGLDEEFNIFDESSWQYYNLTVPEIIKNGLINFDRYFIEMINRFDIQLKNIFNCQYIDLIDYDIGEITIVKNKYVR
jgi:hypothetical protein